MERVISLKTGHNICLKCYMALNCLQYKQGPRETYHDASSQTDSVAENTTEVSSQTSSINQEVLLTEIKMAIETNNKIDYSHLESMDRKIKRMTVIQENAAKQITEYELMMGEMREKNRLNSTTIQSLRKTQGDLENQIRSLTGVNRYVADVHSDHVSSNFFWHAMEKKDKKLSLGLKGYQRIAIDKLSEFRLRKFMDMNELIFVQHPKDIIPFHKRDGFFSKDLGKFVNPDKPREMLLVLKECNCNALLVDFLQNEFDHIKFKVCNGVVAYITFQFIMFKKILYKAYACERIAEAISSAWGDMTRVCIPSVVSDAEKFKITQDEVRFLTNKELWNVPPLVHSEHESTSYVEEQVENIGNMFPGMNSLDEIIVVESLPTGRINSCKNLTNYMLAQQQPV